MFGDPKMYLYLFRPVACEHQLHGDVTAFFRYIAAAVAAGTIGKYQIVVMQLLTICGHDIFFCPVMGSDRCVFSDPYSGGDSQFKESVIQLHPVDLPVGVEELVMYGLAFFKVVENIKILYQRIMDPVQVEAQLTVGLPGLAGHISGAALVPWKAEPFYHQNFIAHAQLFEGNGSCKAGGSSAGYDNFVFFHILTFAPALRLLIAKRSS